jgi:hypothetical protein
MYSFVSPLLLSSLTYVAVWKSVAGKTSVG